MSDKIFNLDVQEYITPDEFAEWAEDQAIHVVRAWLAKRVVSGCFAPISGEDGALSPIPVENKASVYNTDLEGLVEAYGVMVGLLEDGAGKKKKAPTKKEEKEVEEKKEEPKEEKKEKKATPKAVKKAAPKKVEKKEEVEEVDEEVEEVEEAPKQEEKSVPAKAATPPAALKRLKDKADELPSDLLGVIGSLTMLEERVEELEQKLQNAAPTQKEESVPVDEIRKMLKSILALLG